MIKYALHKKVGECGNLRYTINVLINEGVCSLCIFLLVIMWTDFRVIFNKKYQDINYVKWIKKIISVKHSNKFMFFIFQINWETPIKI